MKLAYTERTIIS